VSVPVTGVAPAFWVTATATLTPLVVDASGSTTSLKPIEATAHGFAVPWTLLVVVLLLAALVAGAIVGNRRNRAKRKEREDARVRDAVADALNKEKAAR
jgi:hypothetical protein